MENRMNPGRLLAVALALARACWWGMDVELGMEHALGAPGFGKRIDNARKHARRNDRDVRGMLEKLPRLVGL